MNGYAQASNNYNTPAVEEARPTSLAMTRLASAIGDLETAARALAGRVTPLLPAGSPFSRVDKMAEGQPLQGTSVPRPARSHFTDQLDSRVYSIEAITASINEMVKSIEL